MAHELKEEEEHTLSIGDHAFVVMEDCAVLEISSNRYMARDLADEDPTHRWVVELEITGFYP